MHLSQVGTNGHLSSPSSQTATAGDLFACGPGDGTSGGRQTDLNEQVIKAHWQSKLTPLFETAFNRLGWKFVAHSLLAVEQPPTTGPFPTKPVHSNPESGGVNSGISHHDRSQIEEEPRVNPQGRVPQAAGPVAQNASVWVGIAEAACCLAGAIVAVLWLLRRKRSNIVRR